VKATFLVPAPPLPSVWVEVLFIVFASEIDGNEGKVGEKSVSREGYS
jgi:hypothetical protein